MSGAAPIERDEAVDRTTVIWCGVMLFGAIALQRFGLRLGTSAIPFALPLTLISLLALALAGRLVLSPIRLILFMAVGAYMLLAAAVTGSGFSLPSLAYVLITYASYVLTSRSNAATWRAVMNLFQIMVAICAVLGLAQHFGQKLIQSPLLFTFEGVVPKNLLLPDYNTLIPVTFQATTYKANGFFLVEPSTFSQFLGIAIVVEIAVFGWGKRLLLYFAALPFAYSGTGLLLLGATLPFLLIRQRAMMVLFGIAAIVALVMVSNSVNLEVFINRAAELDSTLSSGFARFVGPAWMLADVIFPHADRLLWGMGPGTIQDHVAGLGYLAVDPTWAKLLFEYGVAGTILFVVFAGRAMLFEARDRLVALALLFCYVMLGGMFLSAYMHALILVLVALHPAPAPAHAPQPKPDFAPSHSV